MIYRTRPWVFRNLTYEFTHWGVSRLGANAGLSHPWRAFRKYRETDRFFLLYLNGADVHIIQKHLFADPFEETRFRDMLQEQISKR